MWRESQFKYNMPISMIIMELFTSVSFSTQQWMQLQWMHIVWTEVEAGQLSYCTMPWSSICAAMEISMCWTKEALDSNQFQLCHQHLNSWNPKLMPWQACFTANLLPYKYRVFLSRARIVCELMNHTYISLSLSLSLSIYIYIKSQKRH